MDVSDSAEKLHNFETDSISMQELSNSIEEIVTTPDVYLFFLPSNDLSEVSASTSSNVYNSITNNNIFNELESNHIEFLKTGRLLHDVPFFSSTDDVDMIQDGSKTKFSTNPLIALKNIDDMRMIENKNNGEMLIETTTKNLINKNNLTHIQSKMIKRLQSNPSDLILVYCSKCKKTIKHCDIRKCKSCQTMLLFQCTNCTSLYKTFVSILNHIKYECYQAPFFYCAECGYCAIRKLDLVKHIQNMHPFVIECTENMYKCSICYRKFKIEQNMLAHEKMCSIAIAHQCQYCPYNTKSKFELKRHTQRKHPEFDTQKYYTCPDCGKKYIRLSSLNHHIVRMCKKKFKFECEHCDFKSDRKFILVKHMQLNHPQLFFKNRFL